MKGNFPWGHQRRFNIYSEYLKRTYGGRLQKLAIDAGFTCPNRDGTKGEGGCTYCDNSAFNPSYCVPGKTVTQQISEGIEFHRSRYRRAAGYLTYFQAYSNTYAAVEKLRTLYEETLSFQEMRGIVIGTRPDCINDEILSYLSELNRRTCLVVEYGIESCYDETLRRINRGHNFKTTVDAINKTHGLGINTAGHMIVGLPGESEEMILQGIKILSGLPLYSLKFHQLQIIRGTVMEKEFISRPADFRIYDLDEYLDLMAAIIGNLNPGIMVDRVAGEMPPRFSANITWDLRYDQILRKFEKVLERKNVWQGKFFSRSDQG